MSIFFYNCDYFLVNFARFGEANAYINKRSDYKFGIRIIRENKTNKDNNYSLDSAHITLNDSLMYFKEESIKL